MTFNTIYIRFEGKGFQPAELKQKTQLPFNILAEPGMIMQKGRYKGKPSPYGLASIEVDSSDTPTTIEKVLISYSEMLLRHKTALKSTGVDNIVFDVEFKTGGDFKATVSSDVFSNLIKLNALLQFHSLSENIVKNLSSDTSVTRQQDMPDGRTSASQRVKQKRSQNPVRRLGVTKSAISAKPESSFISKESDLIVKARSEPEKKTKTRNSR